MKICTKCEIPKHYEDFNKRKSSKDGYAHQCRECNKENLRLHYQNNKQYYADKSKKYRNDFRDFINSVKEQKGCFNCGEKRHWVLDFHHPDNNKEYNISDLLNIQSYSKLKIEIDKCQIICCNCHRDLHYQEKQK